VQGKQVDIANVRGKKTLLLFWNPGCGFCRQMLDDLKAWEANRDRTSPRLVVVSTGSVEANKALGLKSPVLLDQNFTVAPAFGANGTPMAVLLDERARVASRLAVGSPEVLALARGKLDPMA
jgi:thioredoxin-related protein